MQLLAQALVAFVALEHIAFLVIEMFFWQKPYGLKAFRMSKDKAKTTADLAANQGLYNGFLAAGLLWSLVTQDSARALELQTFFLGCVIVAGFYGSLTLRKIFFIQALPAWIALAFVYLA